MNPRSIASTGLACTLALGTVGLTSQDQPTAEAKHRKAKSKRMCVYMAPSKRPSGWRKVKRVCRGKRIPAHQSVPGPPQSPPEAPVVRCDREAWPNTPDAAQKLANSLITDEVGCLHAGTYDPASTYALKIPRSDITIRSAPNEIAKLVGIVYVPRGRDRVTLSHLSIEGDGTQNTIQTYAANTIVEDSDITNRRRGGSCMMLGSNGVGTAVRVVVRRNAFHECGSPAAGNKHHAIYAASVTDGQIVGNSFTTSSAYAVQLYPGANGTLVQGNRIDGTGSIRGGIVLGSSGSQTSSGNVVRLNEIKNAASHGVETAWEGAVGVGNVVERNCMTNNRAGDVAPQAGFRVSSNISGGSECLARLAQ